MEILGFELSPQQKWLWRLQQNSSAYWIQLAVTIDGNLNPVALKNACQTIVEQHEILRTKFIIRPGMDFPIQQVCDRASPIWQELDGRNLNFEQQTTEIDQILQTLSADINIDTNSVLRLALIHLSVNQYILILSLPALYGDNRSLINILEAIHDLLCGKLCPETFLQYAQFSAWRNELISATDGELAKEYWQKQKIFDFLKCQLPGETYLRQTSAFQPKVINLFLDNDVVIKIQEFAQIYNISIEIFLLTCWYIFLWRLSGQSNIIIGTYSDGRSYPELKKSLGLFAQYLPIHFHLHTDNSLITLIQQVDQSVSEARTWQDYFSWEQVIIESGLSPQAAADICCFEFDTLHISKIHQNYSCVQQFKLKLACSQTSDRLFAKFYYNPQVILSDSVQQISQQFYSLLKNILYQPYLSINDITIFSYQEQHKLLFEWNNTQVVYPKIQCISQLFTKQVEQTPNAIAIVFQDQQLTYSELNTKANQLAHYLQKLGIQPEKSVGIYLERSLEMFIGLLAIFKAGGVYVPLNLTYPQERIEFILSETQTSVLLTQQKLVNRINTEGIFPICLDTDWHINEGENFHNLDDSAIADNLAYIIYTSGSTGKPKGIGLTHAALINLLQWHNSQMLTGARTLQFAALSFDVSFYEIFTTWLSGGTLFVIPEILQMDVLGLINFICKYAIEKVVFPVSVLQNLAESIAIATTDISPVDYSILSSLKEVATTGEKLHINKSIIKLFTALNHCAFYNLYGPSETHVVTALRLDSNPNNWVSHPAIGTPIANTQIYLLDTDLNPVPIGGAGEIHIGGIALARGYIKRPDLNAQQFIADPFSQEIGNRLYKTGDLGRYLPDGRIEYLGRIDHQVKIRGFRLELGEIEALLEQHSAVRQVVVLVNQQKLVAYIVPSQKEYLPVKELQQFLQQKLPDYMIPSAFLLLESLPLTAHGKVNRQALLQLQVKNANFVAPRTAAEKVIADIWQQVIGVNQIGIYDNFFDLGGHSLLINQILFQLQKNFQVDLSLQDLFNTSTIVDIVELIEQHRGGREIVEKIAQTFIVVKQMSPAEIKKMLDK